MTMLLTDSMLLADSMLMADSMLLADSMLMVSSTLLATSTLQRFADPMVLVLVALMAWLGSRYGLFLAVVWGLQALASVVVALAITDRVDGWLLWAGVGGEFGMIWRQSIAFGVSLAVVAIAIRVAVGAGVKDEATHYPPLVDLVGGGVMGMLAGFVVAGILQLTLAMVPLPAWAEFDHTKTYYDFGNDILVLFSRCVTLPKDDQLIMMEGERGFPLDKEEPKAAPPPPPGQPVMETIELKQWSEIYADTNWNQQWDQGEKYEDADDNNAFTYIVKTNDLNTNQTRDIGLFERYRLGPWVTVQAMTKDQVKRLQRGGKLGPVPGSLDATATAPSLGTASPQAVPAVGNTVPGGVVPSPASTGPPAATFVPPANPLPPTNAVPPATVPATGAPATGTPPGVPRQPGQPAAAAPGVPLQSLPPAVPLPGAPGGTPIPPSGQPVPQPAPSTDTPLPAGPQSPFKPAPKK